MLFLLGCLTVIFAIVTLGEQDKTEAKKYTGCFIVSLLAFVAVYAIGVVV